MSIRSCSGERYSSSSNLTGEVWLQRIAGHTTPLPRLGPEAAQRDPPIGSIRIAVGSVAIRNVRVLRAYHVESMPLSRSSSPSLGTMPTCTRYVDYLRRLAGGDVAPGPHTAPPAPRARACALRRGRSNRRHR
ncbi:hypothetical protein [Methylacidiphilum caldifontis]|uniref:hypothetical protein n=1 Tax=Methylacidiphilum caldifontis TaxID=2795386 RepID=UPI001F5D25D4|nr:hypothetical protein [Methylacidiphilum caldifontis]